MFQLANRLLVCQMQKPHINEIIVCSCTLRVTNNIILLKIYSLVVLCFSATIIHRLPGDLTVHQIISFTIQLVPHTLLNDNSTVTNQASVEVQVFFSAGPSSLIQHFTFLLAWGILIHGKQNSTCLYLLPILFPFVEGAVSSCSCGGVCGIWCPNWRCTVQP